MRQMRYAGLCFLLLAVLLLPGIARAQGPTTRPTPKTLLVTLGPGQEIYEKFSHNAIWIHDPGQYYADVAFNYGLFSFGGDFVPRFVMGTMRYWMAGQDALEMIEAYRLDNRSIWIQPINIPEETTQDLATFLWRNAEPENRYYTYNYYTDNCSTRVRDALDHAVGGAIHAQTSTRMTGRTYRFHTLRVMAENPLLYIGVDFLLGSGGDRDLSEWEEMFLPQYMMQHLQHVTLKDGTPLVGPAEAYATSDRAPIREQPPRWTGWFLLAGILIASSLLLCDRYAARKWARICRAILLASWLGLAAIAGLMLTFMSYFTDHWITRANENLYQMPPITIVPLVLLPWALRRRNGAARHPLILRIVTISCVVVLGLAIQGLVQKCHGAFVQDNWRIIALSLPVHAATAIIFLRAHRNQTVRGASTSTETIRT